MALFSPIFAFINHRTTYHVPHTTNQNTFLKRRLMNGNLQIENICEVPRTVDCMKIKPHSNHFINSDGKFHK